MTSSRRGGMWGATLVVVLAVLLCLATVPVAFGMGTDCTDNANRGCQVIDRGAGANIAMQVLIGAGAVVVARRRRPHWSEYTLAATGVALCLVIFTGTLLYAHSYPKHAVG